MLFLMFLRKLKLALRNRLEIDKNNTIHINKGVRIRNCHISIKGIDNSIIFQSETNLKGVRIEVNGINCHVSVGENSVIGENTYLSCRERNTTLEIGKGCMLSRNIKIMTSDGHDIILKNTRINFAKNIKIEDHVWLADGVTVLKGVTIGSGCVIGIGSLVTKDIEENCIAAGWPATIKERGISWRKKLSY